MLLSIALSAGSSCLLETAFAMLWGAGRDDRRLVRACCLFLDPWIVLAYTFLSASAPGVTWPAIAVLEALAAAAEGRLLAVRGRIAKPYAFAFAACAFALLAGMFLVLIGSLSVMLARLSASVPGGLAEAWDLMKGDILP